MSETTQDDPPPHHQKSLMRGDDAQVAEAVLGNGAPSVRQASPPGNFRPTRHFPADPSRLGRPELEEHYRAMRHSHKFLVRSRAQLQRRSRESKDKRQDLLNTIHHYTEQYSALGRERTEQFQLAREFKQKLEAFERSQQDLDQLLSQAEDVHGDGGFWGFLKVAELLKRMRELLLSNGIRQ